MSAADDAPARFLARLQSSLADGSFQRLQLSRPHDTDPSLDKVLARRVVLRGLDHLSFVWRHRTKDITKNLPLADAQVLVSELVAQQFHHAHLLIAGHDVQLIFDRKGRWALRVGKVAAAASVAAAAPAAQAQADGGADGGLDVQAHGGPGGAGQDTAAQRLANAGAPSTALNRARQHALGLDTPFLAELGVADAQGRLVPSMARKWRQINKFVEVLGHAIGQSPLATRDPTQAVRVLDFGAGKGYLTFAVHHHLVQAGRVPDVVGVELRDDLTGLCNQAIARLGLQGLRFDTGDVRLHQAGPPGSTDIMIALHACDTATDLAMHRGVQAGASVILCSPCCHKELRPQMKAPAALQPLLRHGIHMAQQAEMLTDSLRALLLQAAGYDAQVFEFISPEATSKNKMVLAVRRATPPSAAQVAQSRAQVQALKAEFGVRQQTLDTLLFPPEGGSSGTGLLTPRPGPF